MGIGAWCKIFYTERVFCHLSRVRGGVYVIDEKWDNFVILDACRYDMFRQTNTIHGKLESRISRGSDTVEFLSENFLKHPQRSSFGDVVYVAANPLVSSLLKDRFHKIYPVWDYGWDDKLGTVPPGEVVRVASDVRKKYPDKRLIVHFMQPHFPALTGKLGNETGISGLRRIVKMDLDPVATSERRGPLDVLPESLLRKGELSKDKILFAYQENLRTVVAYASRLVESLPGRTVISADHGEAFGDRSGILYPFRVFGHPQGLHISQLVVVPWLVLERGINNRSVESTTPQDVYSSEEEAKVKDRLRKLGYD